MRIKYFCCVDTDGERCELVGSRGAGPSGVVDPIQEELRLESFSGRAGNVWGAKGMIIETACQRSATVLPGTRDASHHHALGRRHR